MLELSSQLGFSGVSGEPTPERVDGFTAPPIHRESPRQIEVQLAHSFSVQGDGAPAHRHTFVDKPLRGRRQQSTVRQVEGILASVFYERAKRSRRETVQTGTVIIHGALENEPSVVLVHEA